MDFLTDNNPIYLNHFLQDNSEIAGLIKGASVSTSDLSELDAKAFADPINREYPINTAENALKSYTYFKTAGVVSPRLEKELQKAAAFHTIIDLFQKVDAELEKSAAIESEDDYALIADLDGSGTDLGFYPINNAFNLEKSASELVEDMHFMPALHFRTASYSIVKKAEELNMLDRIPRLVKAAGSDKLPDLDRFEQSVAQRINLLNDRETKEAQLEVACYKHIVEEVKKASVSQNDPEICLWLETMKQADEDNGFDKMAYFSHPFVEYYSGVSDAELEKLANEVISFDVSNENIMLPLEDFTANLHKIACVFGNDQRVKDLESFQQEKNASVINSRLQKWNDSDKQNLLLLIAAHA